MTYLTLTEIKKHLNIDSTFEDDDTYLTSLGDLAEDVVERHIDISLSDIVADDGTLPPPAKHAMLLLIGNFYANRESVTNSGAVNIPNSFEYLIGLVQSYKKYAEDE